MAGIMAAGAIGAALAVGGVAYAAGDPDTGNGDRIVRVVEEDGATGYTGTDCPDRGGSTGGGTEGSGDTL
jgi:hypothetical protein